METKIDFEGIDYQELAIYIALQYPSHYEIPKCVRNLVPVRTKTRGPRPGPTGGGALGQRPTITSGQWRFHKTEYTEEEKRRLLAKAIELAILYLFNSHCYTFRNNIKLEMNVGVSSVIRS